MGSIAQFTLIVNATGYVDTLNFYLMIGGVGSDFVTHDCGNVKFSVTRYGTLGYMSPIAPKPGDGFCYPLASASHLYYGSLAFGNSRAYCVDRFYTGGIIIDTITGFEKPGHPLDRYLKNGNCNADWRTTLLPEGSARMDEPGPFTWDEYATARYDDSTHKAPKGVVCEQRSWAYNDPTADDFVTLELNLRNAGSTVLTGLYAALFMDWDVGSATANQGATDTARKLAWIYQSTPYVGVAILNPPRSVPAANLAMVSHRDYVFPMNGLPDSIKFNFMNGTIQKTATDTVYDWSMCTSSGPFTLNPSGTFIAAFAILAGDNLADLRANADTAYERYWSQTGTCERGDGLPAPALFDLYPSIARGRTVTVVFNCPMDTPRFVSVYNALGQCVVGRTEDRLARAATARLDLGRLAPGIYFVKVDAGGSSAVRKIILCD